MAKEIIDANYEEVGMEKLYGAIIPISYGLSGVLKKLLSAPNNRELLYQAKMQVEMMRHSEKMEILRLVSNLAEKDQLSDERFRLLMSVFSIE